MVANSKREVAVVAFAQSAIRRDAGSCNEVELIAPVIREALDQAGLDSVQDVGFTCSGSCDYLQGAAFAFVSGLDALGAVPPIKESHVEMDGAWALYEAWLKIQTGEVSSALLYGFSKSSQGDLPSVLSLQLDPYYLQPLWPDSVSLAALQARAMLDKGDVTEADMARVVADSRQRAKTNAYAQLAGDVAVETLLDEPEFVAPLRRHDCCPVSDGASAVIICTVEKAKEWGRPYALIRGIDHRIETHNIGARDLTRSVSTEIAAKKAGACEGPIDIAEICAPFSHQHILLQRALGLDSNTTVNPSGGVLAGNPMMAAGLSRIGEVAMRIIRGEARRGLAHATSGPCLQQNMVVVLEGV